MKEPNPWSFIKPKEPGMYFINYGDVVTVSSLEVQVLRLVSDKTSTGAPNVLVDQEGVPVADYNNCYKFMRVDVEHLNKIRNGPVLEAVE